MSTLPKRLIKLRKSAGLSQEEVADKLEVTRQTVSKWETGQSSPDLDKVLPLCELYGVSPDELLGKNDPEPNYHEGKSEDLDDDGDPEDEPLDLKKHLFKRGRDEIKSGNSAVAKSILSILTLIVLVIYLIVSFATMAWYITWIIWIVYALIAEILKLIFALLGVSVDEEKTEKPKNRGLRIFGSILAIFCLLMVIGFCGIFFIIPGMKFFGFHSGTPSTNLSYENSYDIDFDILSIRADASEIELKESANEDLKVRIYSDRAEKVDLGTVTDIFRIDVDGDSCRGFSCLNYKIPKIEVYLPENYADKIEINNNYGDIAIGRFDDASIDVDENMGEVNVKSAKDLKIKNDMGSVEVERVLGSVDLDVSMGSINVAELNLNKNSEINASMGSITIRKTNEIRIDAAADMGSVNMNRNYNDSPVTLKIRTSMGAINVRN